MQEVRGSIPRTATTGLTGFDTKKAGVLMQRSEHTYCSTPITGDSYSPVAEAEAILASAIPVLA